MSTDTLGNNSKLGTVEFYKGYINNLYSLNTISAEGVGFYDSTGTNCIPDSEVAVDMTFRVSESNNFFMSTPNPSTEINSQLNMNKNSITIYNVLQVNSLVNHGSRFVINKASHFNSLDMDGDNNSITLNSVSGVTLFNDNLSIAAGIRVTHNMESDHGAFIHSSNTSNSFTTNCLTCSSSIKKLQIDGMLTLNSSQATVTFPKTLHVGTGGMLSDVLVTNCNVTVNANMRSTNCMHFNSTFVSNSTSGINSVLNDMTCDDIVVHHAYIFNSADDGILKYNSNIVNAYTFNSDVHIKGATDVIINNSVIISQNSVIIQIPTTMARLSVAKAACLQSTLTTHKPAQFAGCSYKRLFNSCDGRFNSAVTVNVNQTLIVHGTNSVQNMITSSATHATNSIHNATISEFRNNSGLLKVNVIGGNKTTTSRYGDLYQVGTASGQVFATGHTNQHLLNSNVFAKDVLVTEHNVYNSNSLNINSNLYTKSNLFLGSDVNISMDNKFDIGFNTSIGGVSIVANSSHISMNSDNTHIHNSDRINISTENTGSVHVTSKLQTQRFDITNSSDLTLSSILHIDGRFNTQSFGNNVLKQNNTGSVTLDIDNLSIRNNDEDVIVYNTNSIRFMKECVVDMTIDVTDGKTVMNSHLNITGANSLIVTGGLVINCPVGVPSDFTISSDVEFLSNATFNSMSNLEIDKNVTLGTLINSNSSVFTHRLSILKSVTIDNKLSITSNAIIKNSVIMNSENDIYIGSGRVDGAQFKHSSVDDIYILIQNSNHTTLNTKLDKSVIYKVDSVTALQYDKNSIEVGIDMTVSDNMMVDELNPLNEVTVNSVRISSTTVKYYQNNLLNQYSNSTILSGNSTIQLGPMGTNSIFIESNSISIGDLFTQSVSTSNVTVDTTMSNSDAVFTSVNMATLSVTNSVSLGGTLTNCMDVTFAGDVTISNSANDLWIGYRSKNTPMPDPVKFIINDTDSNFSTLASAKKVDVRSKEVKIADNAIILSKNGRIDDKVGIFVSNSGAESMQFTHEQSHGNGIWIAKSSDIVVPTSSKLNFNNDSTSPWSLGLNSSTNALEFRFGSGDNLRMKILPSL